MVYLTKGLIFFTLMVFTICLHKKRFNNIPEIKEMDISFGLVCNFLVISLIPILRVCVLGIYIFLYISTEYYRSKLDEEDKEILKREQKRKS